MKTPRGRSLAFTPRAIWIGLCLIASAAHAHSITPEAVIATLAPPPLRARLGIVDVKQAADLPRLLVIRVDQRWSQISPDQRRQIAQRWRSRWRESVPQGVLAIVDAESDASLVSFDRMGRALLKEVRDPAVDSQEGANSTEGRLR